MTRSTKKKSQDDYQEDVRIPTCEPHPLRAIVIDIPPRSSWPPFFAFSTACERRMAPAHVPHTDFVFTNSRRGSKTPESRASNAMVVLSASKGVEFENRKGQGEMHLLQE
jgi:hypothetical protein